MNEMNINRTVYVNALSNEYVIIGDRPVLTGSPVLEGQCAAPSKEQRLIITEPIYHHYHVLLHYLYISLNCGCGVDI